MALTDIQADFVFLGTVREIDAAIARHGASLGYSPAQLRGKGFAVDLSNTPVDMLLERASWHGNPSAAARVESDLVEICLLLLRRGDPESLRAAARLAFRVHDLEARDPQRHRLRSTLLRGASQIGLGELELGIKNVLRATRRSDWDAPDWWAALLADWALVSAAIRARDLNLAERFSRSWREHAKGRGLRCERERADLCRRLLRALRGEPADDKFAALRALSARISNAKPVPLLLGIDWTSRRGERWSFEKLCALRALQADGRAFYQKRTAELSRVSSLFAAWHLAMPLREIERRILARSPTTYVRKLIGRSMGEHACEKILAESHVSSEISPAPDAVIWMTDVWGYSPLSQRTASADLFPTLSPLFRTMNEELEAVGGMILEFIGDSILVVFNAFAGQRTEPPRILAATTRCLTRLRDLGAISEMAGLERIDVGVGINRGEVAVGYLGGFARCHLSALGHTVNVAARLESLTRHIVRNVAVSETLFEPGGPAPWTRPEDVNFSLRDLGARPLKGIEKPPRVFGLAPLLRHFVDFVPMGLVARPEPGVVYLDVGSACCNGIVDHHSGLALGRSACEVVNTRPGLVTEHLLGVRAPTPDEGGRRMALGAHEFRLHETPDLDCAASFYSACEQLEGDPREDLLEALYEYVGDVDQGTIPTPGSVCDSLYGVFYAHTNRKRNPPDRERLEDGLRVIDAAMFIAERLRRGKKTDFSRIFQSEPTWFAEDRKRLRDDPALYEADLSCGHTYEARVVGNPEPVVGLWLVDPKSLLFKQWARTDPRAPSGRGYDFLVVDWSEGEKKRFVISVDPESGTNLRGLGAALEAEEKRLEPWRSAEPRAPVPKRFETDNADPWYFGWGHNYTIVDSPRRGTVLTAAEVEEIHKGWVP